MKRRKRKRWPIIILSIVLLLVLFLVIGYVTLKRLFPVTYKETVQEMSKETNIPESLLFAVIHTESGFRPLVESHLGARGLMQLTEETFDWVKYRKKDTETSYEDLFNPAVNIRYGAWLLELLEKEFLTQTNTLSAYHAGWGNVKTWLSNGEYSNDGISIDKIPFRDTAHYVHKVERAQRIYQLLYQIS